MKSATAQSATVYGQDGSKKGNIVLPESVFGLPWNADLVHQVAVSMLTNRRTPVAHAKTRGEVSGGGKKPWRQKGTGRARHGSIRSPIWVGGGVAHGPRNDKNFARKVNRKAKAKALFTILSKKLQDGEILFVEEISVPSGKTKDAKAVLSALGGIKGFEALSSRRNNAALIALGEKDAAVERGFGNFGSVEVGEVRNIDPVTLLNYKYVVITKPEASIKSLASKLSAKK